MIGNNISFYREILIIVPNLSLLALLFGALIMQQRHKSHIFVWKLIIVEKGMIMVLMTCSSHSTWFLYMVLHCMDFSKKWTCQSPEIEDGPRVYKFCHDGERCDFFS